MSAFRSLQINVGGEQFADYFCTPMFHSLEKYRPETVFGVHIGIGGNQ